MSWHSKIGINHTLKINGTTLTVDREVCITIHNEADIEVTKPSGKTFITQKRKQDETDS